MALKNHNGIIQKIKSWQNRNGKIEVKTFTNDKFLWHFGEDPALNYLKADRFYCPIYKTEQEGREIKKTRHLFYIMTVEDKDGDTVFLEIGPDGYMEPTYHPKQKLTADIESESLVPMMVVRSFGQSPTERMKQIK